MFVFVAVPHDGSEPLLSVYDVDTADQAIAQGKADLASCGISMQQIKDCLAFPADKLPDCYATTH